MALSQEILDKLDFFSKSSYDKQSKEDVKKAVSELHEIASTMRTESGSLFMSLDDIGLSGSHKNDLWSNISYLADNPDYTTNNLYRSVTDIKSIAQNLKNTAEQTLIPRRSELESSGQIPKSNSNLDAQTDAYTTTNFQSSLGAVNPLLEPFGKGLDTYNERILNTEFRSPGDLIQDDAELHMLKQAYNDPLRNLGKLTETGGVFDQDVMRRLGVEETLKGAQGDIQDISRSGRELENAANTIGKAANSKLPQLYEQLGSQIGMSGSQLQNLLGGGQQGIPQQPRQVAPGLRGRVPQQATSSIQQAVGQSGPVSQFDALTQMNANVLAAQNPLSNINTTGFGDLSNRAGQIGDLGSSLQNISGQDRNRLIDLLDQTQRQGSGEAPVQFNRALNELGDLYSGINNTGAQRDILDAGRDASRTIASQIDSLRGAERERQGLVGLGDQYSSQIAASQDPYLQQALQSQQGLGVLGQDLYGLDSYSRDLGGLAGQTDRASFEANQQLGGLDQSLGGLQGRSSFLNQLSGDLGTQTGSYLQELQAQQQQSIGDLSGLQGQYRDISGGTDARFAAYQQAQLGQLAEQEQSQVRQIEQSFARRGLSGSSAELNAINDLRENYSRQKSQLSSEIGLQQMQRQDQALGQQGSLANQIAGLGAGFVGQRSGLDQQTAQLRSNLFGQEIGTESGLIGQRANLSQQQFGNELQSAAAQQGLIGQQAGLLSGRVGQQAGLLEGQANLAGSASAARQGALQSGAGTAIGTRSNALQNLYQQGALGANLASQRQSATTQGALTADQLRSQQLQEQSGLLSQQTGTAAQQTGLTSDLRNQYLGQLTNMISGANQIGTQGAQAAGGLIGQQVGLQGDLLSQGNQTGFNLSQALAGIRQQGYQNQANSFNTQFANQNTAALNQANILGQYASQLGTAGQLHMQSQLDPAAQAYNARLGLAGAQSTSASNLLGSQLNRYTAPSQIASGIGQSINQYTGGFNEAQKYRTDAYAAGLENLTTPFALALQQGGINVALGAN